MKTLVTVACVLALCSMARADDKSSPNGTWKYTTERNGQTIDVTFKLKAEGEKVTGTVTVMDMETKIEDGAIKDGEISFKVIRQAGDNKFEIKYKGKVTGDVFKGKRELERDGQTNSREFEAKRVKD
jgi:hypothetical protein